MTVRAQGLAPLQEVRYFPADPSDIDILVTSFPGKTKGLYERVAIKLELEALCGRDGDVITKKAIEQSRNHLRRREILGSAQVLYVA